MRIRLLLPLLLAALPGCVVVTCGTTHSFDTRDARQAAPAGADTGRAPGQPSTRDTEW